MNHSLSEKLFAEAKTLMPGGVNSPVRAFSNVGATPPFIKRAKGSHIYDVDGNDYIDYVGSWGPMLLGHSERRDDSYGEQRDRSDDECYPCGSRFYRSR